MNIQVKALFIDTFKKEIRNKTLLFALVFSTVSILIGYSLAKVFLQSGAEVNSMTTSIVITGMFAFLNFWAVIISVFFGVSAVRSDFQSNIIYQYLSFPISRTKYFLVRLVGTWAIVFGFYLYSYLLTILVFLSLNKAFAPTIKQLASIPIMGVYTFLYVLLTFLVSLFFNRLGAFITMIFVSAFITVSNSIFLPMTASDYFKDLSVFKIGAMLVHWLLPRLGVLSEMASSLLKEVKPEFNFPIEILHLAITSSILLVIANHLIKKKDF